MSIDRSWMWRRTDDNRYVRAEYNQGVEDFLNFAYSHESIVDDGKIRCPCTRCKNTSLRTRDDVKFHLVKNGFMRSYDKWSSHGEEMEVDMLDEEPFETMGVENNGMEDMVTDLAGPDFDWGARFDEQPPNKDAETFYKLLEAAEEPLFDGCKTHTKLSAVCELFNIKSDYNMPESCYDRVASMMKTLLPEGNSLPEIFYKTKKELAKLGLKYEKIDACKNHCILYYKENKDLQNCPICNHARYKPCKPRSRKKVPYSVLHYLPLTPRLQRLYMSTHTAEQMTWHNKSHEKGTMGHPAHGEAWKDFNKTHPSFSAEPRNVRIGLCTDGFTPFNKYGGNYSCWPVIVTVYNLPPGMCMKEPYMFLSLVIPGPKGPGKSLDVYLRPLIDELKMLWTKGVLTYDVSKKENFLMKVGLMWTISDFPAYGMLSGWSTHGRLACPYCMDRTKSFYLKHGRKQCWFDCHRQFLPAQHRFRKVSRNFRKGQKEKDAPLPRLSGYEIRRRVQQLPDIIFGRKSGKQKIPGFGKEHNWLKKSIFWELPYWHTNLIRHMLDVMHIEKNVFENIFNTIMDVKNKTKDNARARQDLAIYCDRPELNLISDGNDKSWKPKACYCLSKEQIKRVCCWARELKFPDAYVSNIARCVNENDEFHGMKSHDCHVFMQKLLSIAFLDLLPKPVWEALTDLSYFFMDICATVIRVDDMEQLENNIAEILCNLERIFPPGFFDSMEHLPIHLAYEAKVGGPVQYRWMYPFERFLHQLKKKVTNKNKVEASIVNAYLNEEVSKFCSLYFESTVQTKLNRVPRNDDGGLVDSQGDLSIFTQPGRPLGPPLERRRLSENELESAHRYVLMNCDELSHTIEEFEDITRMENPTMSDDEIFRLRDTNFPEWLRDRVESGDEIDERIKFIAYRPSRTTKIYKGYFVNGFKFHNREYGKHKSTTNSGVCVLGSSSKTEVTDYYGIVDEIMELDYFGQTVVLFKCHWFDSNSQKGVRFVHPRFKLVEVNTKSKLKSDEPFIFAHQAYQVYYTDYPKRELRKDRGNWVAVCKTKARGRTNENVYEAADDTFQEQNTSKPGDIPPRELSELVNESSIEEVSPGELFHYVEGVDEEEVEEDEEDEDGEEVQEEEHEYNSESDAMESDD